MSMSAISLVVEVVEVGRTDTVSCVAVSELIVFGDSDFSSIAAI
jgi:hypothetical protein